MTVNLQPRLTQQNNCFKQVEEKSFDVIQNAVTNDVI